MPKACPPAHSSLLSHPFPPFPPTPHSVPNPCYPNWVCACISPLLTHPPQPPLSHPAPPLHTPILALPIVECSPQSAGHRLGEPCSQEGWEGTQEPWDGSRRGPCSPLWRGGWVSRLLGGDPKTLGWLPKRPSGPLWRGDQCQVCWVGTREPWGGSRRGPRSPLWQGGWVPRFAR